MILNFSKGFYDRAAIDKAVEAYKSVAHFKVSDSEGELVVEIFDYSKELADVIGDEFANYVLSEERAKGI